MQFTCQHSLITNHDNGVTRWTEKRVISEADHRPRTVFKLLWRKTVHEQVFAVPGVASTQCLRYHGRMLNPALPALPITDVLPDIRAALAGLDSLVLEAPPGAGKTTIVPLALLNEPWLAGQCILLLEPRRVAARAAAARMAQLLGEEVGITVGYRMRLETRVSAATRIEVVTEGVLTRRLQSDPELDGVGLVIFDEFHERNLQSDLGLALTLQARDVFREDQSLKVLVMSATLDGERIARLLGDVPVVTASGRQYPVAVSYLGGPAQHQTIVASTVAAIHRALAEQPGNILVFLPGQREIHRVGRELQVSTSAAAGEAVMIAPLYGRLALDKQQAAIEPPPERKRKVVLATNVAETSLTIEGICTVVDAGLVREAQFDPVSGITRLLTRRIARDSAEQRLGRAGRLAPGHCYRLWHEEQQAQLQSRSTPAILREDLAALALSLLDWGVADPAELAWLDPPPQAAWEQALGLLRSMGAVELTGDDVHRLTPRGVHMAALPLAPREAQMLLTGHDLGALETASFLAAALSEHIPLGDGSADITSALAVLSGRQPCPRAHTGWCRRAREQARRFRQVVSAMPAFSNDSSDCPPDEVAGLLIATAWPDRIARRRPGSDLCLYQLSNGRSARLANDDSLQGADWLAVAEVGGERGFSSDRIYRAVALNAGHFTGLLAPLVADFTRVTWDSRAEMLVAERRSAVGRITLSTEPLRSVPEAERGEALLSVVIRRGLDLLPWNPVLRQWRARVQLLHDLEPQQWPDLSDSALLESLDVWLLPYLTGVRKLADFSRLDLRQILEALLDWQQRRDLDELLPQSLTVPSGSRVTIDYGCSPPVLAVKLQEMFGCEDTPRVAGGRIPLLVHLLSPARRPLQVTQDLAGFWRGGYEEVRKEMKGRYPKHPWPEDPTRAVATRYTRKRQERG